MATTSLNPNAPTLSSGVTLSNLNLTATATTTADKGASGLHPKLTGKYYFECTFNAIAGGNTGFGIRTGGSSYGEIGTNAQNAASIYRSSSIIVNGVSKTSTGTILVSNTGCCAVDLGAKLIWFRTGAAGNWNGSPTANPATGVGGYDISDIAGALFPYIDVSTSGDSGTLNFGATSFVGTAPSGFGNWTDSTEPKVYMDLDSQAITANNSNVGSITVTLPGTNNTNRIIVVVSHNDGANGARATQRTISSVSGGSLTWHHGSSHNWTGGAANGGPGSNTTEIWWAVAAAQLGSTVLTITYSGNVDGCAAQAFAVVGADTTTPFDVNGSLPANANANSSSIATVAGVSTTNTDGMLLGMWGSDGGPTGTLPSNASLSGLTGFGAIDGKNNNSPAAWAEVWSMQKSFGGAAVSSQTVASASSFISWGWSVVSLQPASTGQTGTWASTEADDVFAGTGSMGAAITGTLSATEAKDVFAGAGLGPPPSGTWASVEAKDTMQFIANDLGIDGFANAGNSTGGITSGAVTLTTTQANDVIVLCVNTKGGSVSSISDVAGLTWTKRTKFNPPSNSTDDLEIWWAAAPTALTADVITIHFSSTNGYAVVAFGVTGANTANPFDAHNANSLTYDNQGGLNGANPSLAITTDFTHNQLIFGFFGTDDTIVPSAVSTGFTTFLAKDANAGAPHAAVGYALKPAQQTALACSFTQNGGQFNDRYMMLDAIVATVPVVGSMFASDVKDTFAGSGYPQMLATWASIEAKDTMTAGGTVPPFGTFAPTEAKDTFGFTGEVGRPLGVDTSAAAVAHDTSSCDVSITTTVSNDVIVLGILSGGFFHRSAVSTITDTAGLVWNRRNTRRQVGVNPIQEIWWAKKHSPGPTTITVNTAAETGFLCVDAIAISGARADAPWDTHTGAGIYNDNFGTGNPTGVIYSNSSKCMGLAFYGSNDIGNDGTVTAGWTYLDTLASGENVGQLGRLDSAYQIFTAQQFGTNTVTFGNVGGGSNNRCIMQDVIVSNNDTTPNAATADVVRWFFDGHGNQMILAMSGSSNSATKELTTFNSDTTVLVAVMVTSGAGARVANVSDSGSHSGWARRSIVTNTVGNVSLELWWVQMADPFSGTVTVTLDDNVQSGDIIGFIALGINGPDLFQRGEIFDGHSSLPASKSSDVASYPTVGPFSTLNENVLEISITSNTVQDPTGFQPQGWLQFIGNNFGSVSGELVSHSPLFNIALQAKFSGPVVVTDTMTMDVSPQPAQWLMLADALPVGPVSPPQGIWGSTEAKDITTHTGNFTAIGIASPQGWVGFPPNHAAMAATDQKDRATNTGAFTAIWDINGWIGFVPLQISWASTEFKDIWASHGWVLGPTTILARWESIEPKDSLGFASLYTWYTTPDSTGDRTSRITVTTNASLGGSSGVPETLVNGLKANNAASGIWVNISQPAAMWFQFDFGSPKVVNEAVWFQNGSNLQPGLWIWQGSNDAATWTDLSGTFTLDAGNQGAVIGDFSSNQTAYRYYRILQTTHAGGNDTPWLWEINFKVAGFSGTLGATESTDRMNYQVQLIPKAVPIPPRKNRLLIVT